MQRCSDSLVGPPLTGSTVEHGPHYEIQARHLCVMGTCGDAREALWQMAITPTKQFIKLIFSLIPQVCVIGNLENRWLSRRVWVGTYRIIFTACCTF